MLDINKILEYVKTKREKYPSKVFPGWRDEDIKSIIYQAVYNKTFLLTLDEKNEIDSLGVGLKTSPAVIHIYCVIAESRKSFKKLLKFLFEKFPSQEYFTGFRHLKFDNKKIFTDFHLKKVSQRL